MKLDICADDGTLLETNYEKQFLEPAPIPIATEVLPSGEQIVPNVEKPVKFTNSDKPGKKSKLPEPEKIKNFAYCKFPLMNQYYYIGDSITRREKPIDPNSAEYISARNGDSEIQEIEKEKNLDSKENREPFVEGGVELEEPFINIPQYPDNEE